MGKRKKNHVVSFWVDDEQWQDLEMAAARAGETVNDWCRKISVVTAATGDGMTPSERTIYEEVVRLRYLIWHAGSVLAGKEITLEEWQARRDQADFQVQDIIAGLQARREAAKEAEAERSSS
jgi:hypothetical protein